MTPLSLTAMRNFARRQEIRSVEITTDERPHGERPRLTLTPLLSGGPVSTTFADVKFLAGVVRRWRSLYGAHLIVNGKLASVCLARNTTALVHLQVTGSAALLNDEVSS